MNIYYDYYNCNYDNVIDLKNEEFIHIKVEKRGNYLLFAELDTTSNTIFSYKTADNKLKLPIMHLTYIYMRQPTHKKINTDWAKK